MLDALQRADQRAEQVRGNLRKSGGRKSTTIIVAVYVVSLSLGAAFSAFVAHSVSLVQALVAMSCVTISLSTTGRFRTRMVPDFVGQLSRVAGSVAAGAAIPFMVIALFDSTLTNFRAFAGLTVVLFATSVAADWTSAMLIRHLWGRGKLRSKAVMIGSGQLADELAIELSVRPEYGVDLVEIIYPGEDGVLAERLVEALASTGGDRLIVAPLENEKNDVPSLIGAVRRSLSLGVPTFVVPRLYQMGLGLDSMSPDRARGYPLVRIQRSAHPTAALRAKRVFDAGLSSFVLFVSAPLMLVIALAVRLTSKGPVLFTQPRVGAQGRVFPMRKFRTMHESLNDHNERSSEYRITGLGRLLRTWSLDELPQFWSVLIGDMTLVGPRPERVSFVEEGLHLYPGYLERHRMPMGITGLAQVAGLRGEDTSVTERVKFDNLYIDQWSFALDLQIIAKTTFAILLQTRYRKRERELAEAITRSSEHRKVANSNPNEDLRSVEL